MTRRKLTTIIKVAIASRLCVWLIALASKQLISDYDKSSALFRTHCNSTLLNDAIFDWIGHFANWDGHYFTEIGIEGYHCEKMFAFFPLMPVLIRVLACILHSMASFVGADMCLPSAAILSGFVISNMCFVFASVALYHLTYSVFKCTDFAFRSAMLFCITPASIFYSAIYTESVFSFLSFSGMWLLSRHRSMKLCAAMLFSLATFARSNGILLAWFFVHDGILTIAGKLYNRKQHQNIPSALSFPNSPTSSLLRNRLTKPKKVAPFSFRSPSKKPVSKLAPVRQHAAKGDTLFHLLAAISSTLVYVSIVVAPYFLFQMYARSEICNFKDLSMSWSTRDVESQHHLADWDCANTNLLVFPPPTIYSHIQAKFWNVGWFKYYTIDQIPNFVLAVPVLAFSLSGIAFCIKTQPRTFFSFALSKDDRDETFHSGKKTSLVSSEVRASPYIFYWLGMLMLCVTFVHVQVSTRFLSVCPAFYWFVSSSQSNITWYKRWATLYLVLGTVLFSNFYPWT